MGPYAVVELPGFAYEVWDRLFAATGALKYWLLASQETLADGQTFRVVMGDASGPMDLTVRRVVRPAEEAPSFMPAVDFALGRSAWGDGVGGRIWLEPGGLRSTILQVFLYGWENLPAGLQLQERKILLRLLCRRLPPRGAALSDVRRPPGGRRRGRRPGAPRGRRRGTFGLSH